MNRIPTIPPRILRSARSTWLRVLLAMMLCLPASLAFPAPAFAQTTGTASPGIVIYYGTGDTTGGEWREDTLTIDGERAYCVEVDSDFRSGMSVSACDPVAKGIWSQEICTKLALIDEFVRSGSFVSTSNGSGNGHRVTNANEQYAVAQCYIWKFLNDAGYSTNHYGWFGASTEGGLDLTGSDTDAQVWAYVRENLDAYTGSAKYYDCGSSQDLACEFSLAPATGYIALTKRSANEELSSKSASYSLEGARYGIYMNKDCSKESLVGSLVTNAQGKARSAALEGGQYYVKETKASPGYAIDEEAYPVTVTPGGETLVNAKAGCVFEQPLTGGVSLQKESARESTSQDNSCYTLEGALFGIYSDQACKKLIGKMETNADGFAQASGLPLGTCYVREISAPSGYAVTADVFPVIVENGKVASVNKGHVADLPKCALPSLILRKQDAQAGSGASAQGAASLANAEFTVRFFPGAFESAEEAEQSGEARCTWTFKTGEDGTAAFDNAHLVAGDPLPLSSEGLPCLPLGTILITESMPPEGYLANNETWRVRIPDDGSAAEIVESYEAPTIPDQVKRGDFEFVKMSGTQDNTLAGIPFVITSTATGERHVIVTDADGRASTASSAAAHSASTNGNDWLLEEGALDDASAGSGDSGSGQDNAAEEAAGDEAGNTSPSTPEASLPPIDGDDSAKAEAEGEAKADSEAEGKAEAASESGFGSESGAAGDSNAESSSKSDPEDKGAPEADVKDTTEADAKDTTDAALPSVGDHGSSEANDPAEDEGDSGSDQAEEAGQTRKPDAGMGIWFGSCGDSTVAVDDSMGALPYGTYLVEELPCKENEGLQLARASVIISEDGQTVDLGFVDDPLAAIATIAQDSSDSDKTIAASEEASITDSVSYSNLIPGRSYVLSGTLMSAETGEAVKDASGAEITASTEFVPEEDHGTQEITFTLDTTQIEAMRLVAFETLRCDGRIIAVHEDIESTEQSVSVAAPSIRTQASGSIADSQYSCASSRCTITDTVSYSSVIPGKEYMLVGTLMDAESGNPIEADGAPVSASCPLISDEGSGAIQLTFEFDARDLPEDAKVVVFEKLFAQDRLVASHEDVNDAGQTITVVKPAIQTSISNQLDEEGMASIASTISLVDQIAYTNLEPGREYQILGRLMNAQSGDAALDAQGEAIETLASFIPEQSSGTTQVSFEFDGENLSGQTLVAFETLKLDDEVLAEHADLESQAQSIGVTAPQIQTYACDSADHDQVVEGESQVKVTDSVSIMGAVPGRSYTVVGLLMDKATGLPLLTGQSAQTEPIAEEELERFWNELLDASGLGREEGAHGTSLSIEAPVEVDVSKAEHATDQFGDIASSIALESREVTADSSSFTQDMEFAFSTEGLSGQAVVFEALVDNESGKLVALHADLNDGAQTFEIESPKTDYPPSESKAPSTVNGRTYDKTGNLLARYAWILALLAAVGCASGVAGLSQRRRRKRWNPEIWIG